MFKKVVKVKSYKNKQGTQVAAHQRKVSPKTKIVGVQQSQRNMLEFEKLLALQGDDDGREKYLAVVKEDDPQNFHGQDLSNIDLNGLNLSGYNFSDSNLEKVCLDGAKFYQTDFAGANMQNVSGKSANFSGAKFGGANLSDSDFSNADFFMVSFDGCTLRRTTLEGSTMVSSVLVDADASGANLCNVKAMEGDWQRANLDGADLSGANLRSCDLRGASWNNTKTDGMLVDVDENYVVKQPAQYDKLTFAESEEKLGISDARFEYLVLSGVIEVRDNITCGLVGSGFDMSKHHVPIWSHAKVTAFLQ
jgi:uncharacterized protein YjbI with pentapeptide repeats